MSQNPTPTQRVHCLCGCGQQVSGKSNYRPGHDARHVRLLRSRVLHYMATHREETVMVYVDAMRQLPTFALREKFRDQIVRDRRAVDAKLWADHITPASHYIANDPAWRDDPRGYHDQLIATLVRRCSDPDLAGRIRSVEWLACLLAGIGWTRDELQRAWS